METLTTKGRGQLVLVADDSAIALEVVERRVRACGLGALALGSATGARGVDPALLSCALLDLDLGDGDGREVARAFRAARPELPIAFFSGSATAEAIADARVVGPVFTKPDELDLAIAWIQSQAE